MEENNTTINLDGTNHISNIPTVYFDTTANILSKVQGNEVKIASKYVGRIGFGAGIVIATTVNLQKDPDNPGKVIASTVGANGIVYYVAGKFAAQAIMEVMIGAAIATAAAAGIVLSAPVVATVTVVGAAIAANIGYRRKEVE